MKTKIRLAFAGALFFVLFGSYKILEPVLYSDESDDGQKMLLQSITHKSLTGKSQNISLDEVSSSE